MKTAEQRKNAIPTGIERIYSVIEALMELEAKGCHSFFFEYGNGLIRVRILRIETNEAIYEKTINLTDEQEQLDELSNHVKTLRLSVYKTVFQCYKREFVIDKISGKWEKCKPFFEVSANATLSMQLGGLGNFIDDPDNDLQYFVDMKQLSETEE